MQTDSMFWIASQSKPITAAALMMLVDEGKVSVDDPVEKYLPEFRGQMVVAEKDADHVLLRRPKHPDHGEERALAHQRAAVQVGPGRADARPVPAERPRVRSYAMTPLDFEPDSKYQYSNAGINTAARIIEVVAAMPFEKFLDERLLQPLGMKDTTFWPSAGAGGADRQVLQAGSGQPGTRRDDDRPALLSADRPHRAVSDAGRRAVLHGARRRPLLPDAPRRRPVGRQALLVRSGREAVDQPADAARA